MEERRKTLTGGKNQQALGKAKNQATQKPSPESSKPSTDSSSSAPSTPTHPSTRQLRSQATRKRQPNTTTRKPHFIIPKLSLLEPVQKSVPSFGAAWKSEPSTSRAPPPEEEEREVIDVDKDDLVITNKAIQGQVTRYIMEGLKLQQKTRELKTLVR